jgi:hypothetical protein
LETSLVPLPKEEMQKAMLITARSHLYWVSWPMAVPSPLNRGREVA